MATKGQIIHRLRKSLGLTLDELGKMVGTSRQTISRYERDEITTIPADKVELLAKALCTTPSAILGWSTPAEESTHATPHSFLGTRYDHTHRMNDDSMSADGIRSGDILFIMGTDDISFGKIYLVSLESELMVRRIYPSGESGEFFLSSAVSGIAPQIFKRSNPAHKVLGIVSASFHIID